MKYFYILVMALTFLNSCGKAQTAINSDNSDPALKEIINTFFKKYSNSPSEAIDYIFKSNKSFTPQQASELKDKFRDASLKIGLFNGFEPITTKNTTSSFVLFSYLVKHDNQPIRFTFIFYKPKNDWMLYKFKFDDSLDAELEESGRIYFIKS